MICSLGKRGGIHLETFKSERNSQLFFTVEVLVFYFSDQFRVNKNTPKLHGDICPCPPKMPMTIFTYEEMELDEKGLIKKQRLRIPIILPMWPRVSPKYYRMWVHERWRHSNDFGIGTSIPPFWLAVLGDTKRVLCLHVNVHLHLLAFWLL